MLAAAVVKVAAVTAAPKLTTWLDALVVTAGVGVGVGVGVEEQGLEVMVQPMELKPSRAVVKAVQYVVERQDAVLRQVT